MYSSSAAPRRRGLLWWLRGGLGVLVGLAVLLSLLLYATRVPHEDDKVYTIHTTKGQTPPPCRKRDTVRVIVGPKEVLRLPYNQTVVISAGCTPYQLWQQVVAVNSLKAMQEKHKFHVNIERVIACSDPEATLFGEWLSPYHLAPEFTNQVPKAPYAPLNKPGALHHWMTHGAGRLLPDDHEIIVVDSDFIFVGPIGNPLSQPGAPVGAHFSLGDMFHKKGSGPLRDLCKGKCDHWTEKWQQENEIGPPYAFRKADGVVLIKAWYELTVAMLEGIKFEYYFDMFAYMIGSFIHNLPHKCVWGMFLVNGNEIWDRLNATTLGNVWAFHYAGNYKLIEDDLYRIWFHKHQYKKVHTVREMILSCSESDQQRMWSEGDSGPHPHDFNPAPWLKEPFHPPTMSLFSPERKVALVERERWVMWTIYQGINDALARFRRDYCGDEGETEENE